MAIKGVARFHRDKKKHIITTQTVRMHHVHYDQRVAYVLYRSTNASWTRAASSPKRALT